ncbi:hypothetical protein IFR05_014690 [Cadophora sp. M221]|nr:hypothetical protein IFR05_014690 [Cadophora sp. M221]
MRALLRVLLEYWDLMRLISYREVLGNFEFVRALTRGVFDLLDTSNCLMSDSQLIKSYKRLRQQRKQLLSVLQSLFKAAAHLQEDHLIGMHHATHRMKIDNAIETVILKAFQTVARAAHFLDTLDTLHGFAHKTSITVAGRTYHFPSPPLHQLGRLRAQPEAARPTESCSPRNSIDSASATLADCRLKAINPTGLNENFLYCELAHDEDGKVIGGTFAALVAKLTACDAELDWSFVSTFYLTFRFFASPLQFANTLLAQFDESAANLDQGAIPAIQRFAITIVREYPKAEPLLRSKIEAVLYIGKPAVVRSAVLMMLDPFRTDTSFQRAPKTEETSSSVLRFDSLQFAQQLTITTFALFCLIKDEELFGREWAKRSESNVKAVIAFSTSLSHLVANDIMKHKKPLKRARSIKHWIDIADRCTRLRNYESSMAIIASLNFASVGRLKKSWELVPANEIAILQSLASKLSTKNNFGELRKLQDSSNRPCLPYLGSYLKDLTFTGDGNADTKTIHGLNGDIAIINFDKHPRMAKIVSGLQYLQVPYPLTSSLEIRTWLQQQVSRIRLWPNEDLEDRLYRESKRLEPREVEYPRPPYADHGLIRRIQYKLSTLSLGIGGSTT